jgi:hypothetical protein
MIRGIGQQISIVPKTFVGSPLLNERDQAAPPLAVVSPLQNLLFRYDGVVQASSDVRSG